ncbi:hypothetical protein P4S72_25235 [Vibrio sp. PP-XX7]
MKSLDKNKADFNKSLRDLIEDFLFSVGPISTDSDFCSVIIRTLKKLFYLIYTLNNNLNFNSLDISIPDYSLGPKNRIISLYNETLKIESILKDRFKQLPNNDVSFLIKNALYLIDLKNINLKNIKSVIACLSLNNVFISQVG